MRGNYDDWKTETPDDEWNRIYRSPHFGIASGVSEQQARCDDCGMLTLYRVAGVPLCKRCQARDGR